jgi:hypothetical protein
MPKAPSPLKRPSPATCDPVDMPLTESSFAACKVGHPVEVMMVRPGADKLQCQFIDSKQTLWVRTYWTNAVPGEIVTVIPLSLSKKDPRASMTAKIVSARLDAPALRLVPLHLRSVPDWDPAKESWFDPHYGVPSWGKHIMVMGVRPSFQMDRLYPQIDRETDQFDAVVESIELMSSGKPRQAHNLLYSVLELDIRSLDAHCHLGAFSFDRDPALAARHFAVGKAIGDLSLGRDFGGVLMWPLLDNRPYLRCVHGLACCHWRLGNMSEAETLFRYHLWLDPNDSQGARFAFEAVERRITWQNFEDNTM